MWIVDSESEIGLDVRGALKLMTVAYSFIVLGTQVIVMAANYRVWPLGQWTHRNGMTRGAADAVSDTAAPDCRVTSGRDCSSLTRGYSGSGPGPGAI